MKKVEGGAREDLILVITGPRASPTAEFAENETAVPELQSESGGKKYRVFIWEYQRCKF